MSTLHRLWAFLTGNMDAAEDIGAYPKVPRVSWIEQAALIEGEDVAGYALEAARRSAEEAKAGVDGIQNRAASLLTLLIGLVPLLIAAIGLAAPHGDQALIRLAALLVYVGASFALVTAIVMAALATGLTLGGGLNLARLLKSRTKPSLARLKAAEADAWHFAAMMAMEAATRKAHDLFRARQFMLWALILSILGTILLALSVGGNLRDLLADPAASSSPTETMCESRGGAQDSQAGPNESRLNGTRIARGWPADKAHRCHDAPRPAGH